MCGVNTRERERQAKEVSRPREGNLVVESVACSLFEGRSWDEVPRVRLSIYISSWGLLRSVN